MNTRREILSINDERLGKFVSKFLDFCEILGIGEDYVQKFEIIRKPYEEVHILFKINNELYQIELEHDQHPNLTIYLDTTESGLLMGDEIMTHSGDKWRMTLLAFSVLAKDTNADILMLAQKNIKQLEG